jgi:alpha-methylacyl-CoA racemase
MLAGNAPYYRCYACADGKYIAVGALERAFFQTLWRMLDLGDAPDHGDRGSWPRIERAFAETFLTRTRDAWAAMFAGTDACVTPVMAPDEVWDEPQIRHRHPLANGRAVPPMPRLARTPGMADATDLSDRSREVLAEAGLSPEDIDAALPSEAANAASAIPF